MIKFSKIKFRFFFLSIFILPHILHSQIFVSPNGDDVLNNGTIDKPYKTISKALSVIQLGDTIYLRGGIYYYNVGISISKYGSQDKMYYLFAYPGDSIRPVLDFSGTAFGTRGVGLSGRYWHIKGIDICNAGDNGMYVSGSYNLIEFCAFYGNKDTGLQLSGGASNNRIINCDSYFNIDPDEGDADGFSPKLNVGTGNYFYGCRAWQNSDDGYDGYLRNANDVTTIYENCWAFKNGYRPDGTPSSGNGNGFKMGGSDDKTLMHNVVMKNCIAFDNRIKGFDQNNNKGSMWLYNCTAYRNGINYGMSGIVYTDSGKVMSLINCAVMGDKGSIWSSAIQKTNSWMPPFNVTSTDFLSLDTTGVRGPRNSDGSLPELPFLRLARGSQLIDAGTDVGIPYFGSAPDIGAYESNYPNGVKEISGIPNVFYVMQNYPNPFNSETNIHIGLYQSAYLKLIIYDILGQEVFQTDERLLEEGNHVLKWSGFNNNYELQSSGMYFYRIIVKIKKTNQVYQETKKMLYLR